MGAVHLFCALRVASRITLAQGFRQRCCADCKTFLLAGLTGPTYQGLKVRHLLLDNGSTHAPTQLANWMASLQLSFEGRIYGRPTHASWLDHVEIICSQVRRDVLTPNDFSHLKGLEKD